MRRRTVATVVCVLCLAAMLGLTGCTCVQRGVAIGGGAGALAGAAIGSITADAGVGALIGAGSGAIVGALVGDGMCQPDSDDEIANLKNQVAALTKENENLKNQVAALTAENERLKKVAPATGKAAEFVIEGDVLFPSGSNVLTPKGIETLAVLADKIRKDYPGKSLNIEGHTDNVPIGASGWKSNWELGSGRALSVLHYMIQKERFGASTMSATTYGEYKPVKPNDTADSRRQNRRAVIVVTLK